MIEILLCDAADGDEVDGPIAVTVPIGPDASLDDPDLALIWHASLAWRWGSPSWWPATGSPPEGWPEAIRDGRNPA